MAPRVKKNRPIMEHRPVTGMIIRRAALRERGEQVKGEQGSRRSPSAEHRARARARARAHEAEQITLQGKARARTRDQEPETRGFAPGSAVFFDFWVD